MGINIAIWIAAQQKGFLVSLAKLLSENNNVIFIAKSAAVKRAIVNAVPEFSEGVDVQRGFDPDISADEVIKECLEREQQYGEFFSMVLSQDRALGKGYLFNADRHPDIVRSWWSHEDKLKAILEEFIYYEHIVDDYSPDLVISLSHRKPLALIARHHGIPYLALQNARLGSRYCWIENEYLQNSWLITAVKENLRSFSDVKEFSSIDYVQVTASKVAHSRIDYSYRTAVKNSLEQIVKRIWVRSYQVVRGRYRRESYRLLGWVPPVLRRPYAYNYFLKYGVKPEEVKKYKLVYFPLHLEPEVSLLAVSPEFNNSMETIAWISKSLPADTLLVVKEQPFSYGIRSKHYYDNLRRIGNVVLAYPRLHSWDWIEAADVVATITGTAGFEAVYFEKPVLSFGKHQVINHLPTVRYANNHESTREHVNELLEMNRDDRIFKISKEALYRAQMDVSFELPGYGEIRKSRELHMDLASIAVEKLYEQYAEVFQRDSQ